MNIGTAARLVGLTVDTVRYYERRGLIHPVPRSISGYRQYAREDIQRLRFIQHAKDLGFTLEEIRQLLALRTGGADCVQVKQIAEAKAAEIRSRIRKLSAMYDVLIELASQCEEEGSTDTCPILKALEESDG